MGKLPIDTPYDSRQKIVGEVTSLFTREHKIITDRSSSLFMFFAQWFTDSVLRVHPIDRRKNTSNHNIDLCQIYGLTEDTCRLLREGEKGRLRCHKKNNEEFLDYLGKVDENGKWQVKEHYTGLPYANEPTLDRIFADWDDSRRHKLYATGLERGNSSIGYVAISTIFMREHNRICSLLTKEWDDERLFQTARLINTIILLKLVIEEYINHIAGAKIFHLDHTFAEQQNWYRTPWIALEFDMLYRWHSLVPDKIIVDTTEYGHEKYRVNNDLFEKIGIAKLIDSASKNPAGKIGMGNVPKFLLGAEYQTIKMGRDFRLRSYNEYRKKFGLSRINSFEALTKDSQLRSRLKSLYKKIDDVEFIVGLFAESSSGNRLYGKLMYTMVAYDAFTQIYSNPLLSTNVYNENTLSPIGLGIIENTNSFQDLVDRNVANSESVLASFSIK